MKYWVAALAPLLLTACATTQVASFTPTAKDQTTVVRDGVPALLSQKAGSVVLVRQSGRSASSNARGAYVVALFNPSSKPINFTFDGLSVEETAAGQTTAALHTYSYDELVAEEKRTQVAMAILTGLAAGANAAAAANSGYYNGYGTVTGPYGTSHVSVSGYSPTAAAIATANANAQNQAMISNAIETGRQNMANLDRSIIKDDTILPGEWYGGVLMFDAPKGRDAKTFRITVRAGNDVHVIDVLQAPKA